MNQIHFIGGEKGGVGKSVMARVLAQYFIDRNHEFKAYDTDLSHGAMMRYYQEFSEPVIVTRYESIDKIIEETVASGAHAIVDLAAQTSQAVNQWILDAGILELADELGFSITFWHVMDDGSDTLMLLEKQLNYFSNLVNFIIVRNYGRGQNFHHYEQSEVARMAQESGAKMIDLPALHPPTMQKIDHISASFWAASNNTDSEMGPTLGLLERQRVKTWLNKTYQQLDRSLMLTPLIEF
jgi:hypothetical protein